MTQASSSIGAAPAERIPAAQRREQILAAASVVFGERGYEGATTEQVARAAGISQPYVVRMFGGKEQLFIEVLERALDKLLDTFREVLARDLPEAERSAALGAAYVDLITDRGILLSLMHGFVTGHVPAIAETARRGWLVLYRLLRDDAGFEPMVAEQFLAQGMLLNTLLALRMPELHDTDSDARELLQSACGAKLPVVLAQRG